MLQLELAVEMVLDDALVAAGDEDEMLDAGLARLVDHMLDQRPVDDRQHLLRHGLGGGQEAGAEAGDRENGFADGFHDPLGRQVRTGGILPSRSRRSLMLRNPDRLDGIAYYRIAAENGAYERGGIPWRVFQIDAERSRKLGRSLSPLLAHELGFTRVRSP